MKKLLTCAFNMDTACVELRFSDGSMCSIDTIAVENEIARNMYERSDLDYLIYNAPLAYAELILNGDTETYLKTVTEYKPLDEYECPVSSYRDGALFLCQEPAYYCASSSSTTGMTMFSNAFRSWGLRMTKCMAGALLLEMSTQFPSWMRIWILRKG